MRFGGTASADLGWRNHGTAVVGEISGDLNAVAGESVVEVVDIGLRDIDAETGGW
ncbi:hypothetical protein ACFWUP_29085 [Nocardia sp. NPDC058658]|uniref:hypothetical protein n=1 Tax=Nocardia sp. NPDC058658 TaxID=3346580 RepID=UPI003663D1F6